MLHENHADWGLQTLLRPWGKVLCPQTSLKVEQRRHTFAFRFRVLGSILRQKPETMTVSPWRRGEEKRTDKSPKERKTAAAANILCKFNSSFPCSALRWRCKCWYSGSFPDSGSREKGKQKKNTRVSHLGPGLGSPCGGTIPPAVSGSCTQGNVCMKMPVCMCLRVPVHVSMCLGVWACMCPCAHKLRGRRLLGGPCKLVPANNLVRQLSNRRLVGKFSLWVGPGKKDFLPTPPWWPSPRNQTWWRGQKSGSCIVQGRAENHRHSTGGSERQPQKRRPDSWGLTTLKVGRGWEESKRQMRGGPLGIRLNEGSSYAEPACFAICPLEQGEVGCELWGPGALWKQMRSSILVPAVASWLSTRRLKTVLHFPQWFKHSDCLFPPPCLVLRQRNWGPRRMEGSELVLLVFRWIPAASGFHHPGWWSSQVGAPHVLCRTWEVLTRYGPWLQLCPWSRHVQGSKGQGSTDPPTTAGGGRGRRICTGTQRHALPGAWAVQGMDRALARRVQNQFWVQGLV